MPAEPDDTPGGRGEGPYLSPVQENKILALALNPRNRFKLEEKHKAEAIEVTSRNMQNEDGRISNAAVANLIKMESLNQKDEHFDKAETQGGVTVNVQNNGGSVSVVDSRSELAAICAAALERSRIDASARDSNGHNGHANGGGNGS